MFNTFRFAFLSIASGRHSNLLRITAIGPVNSRHVGLQGNETFAVLRLIAQQHSLVGNVFDFSGFFRSSRRVTGFAVLLPSLPGCDDPGQDTLVVTLIGCDGDRIAATSPRTRSIQIPIVGGNSQTNWFVERNFLVVLFFIFLVLSFVRANTEKRQGLFVLFDLRALFHLLFHEIFHEGILSHESLIGPVPVHFVVPHVVSPAISPRGVRHPGIVGRPIHRGRRDAIIDPRVHRTEVGGGGSGWGMFHELGRG